MATTAHEIEFVRRSRLSVFRVAGAGALTLALFFVLCWIGARIGFGPGTHMYVQLYSNAEVSSTTALVLGVCWSLAAGLIVGGLFAWLYNLFALFDER